MDNELLASLFDVHASTISRYFQKLIDVLFERLKLLVKWPEHEQLYKTMPKEFKNFSKCIVIIDCFEVFMERPKGLMARAQTWSNYKHHNTVKFLIGITPQGSITFISKGWGGCVSDRYLTKSVVFWIIFYRETLFWQIGGSTYMKLLVCIVQK